MLTEFAAKEIKTHFQIEKLDLDNFETINSYLIYQIINLIYTPDKDTKPQFYIPDKCTTSCCEKLFQMLCKEP